MTKFEIKWEGRIYDFEWSDKTNFEDLKKVITVAGFILDKSSNLCLIKLSKHDKWALPGGHVEPYDKSFEDTLIREVNEEADLDLKDIRRVGYTKSAPRDNPKDITIQLRFVARVKKIRPQTIDPAENEIPERIFISPKEFDKYAKWGYNGEFQLEKALKKLQE